MAQNKAVTNCNASLQVGNPRHNGHKLCLKNKGMTKERKQLRTRASNLNYKCLIRILVVPIQFSCPIAIATIYIAMIFGYLANEKWLYEQVIDHDLAVEPSLAEFDSQAEYDQRHEEVLEGRRTSAMMRVADRLRAETGIYALRLDSVWVTESMTMLCWRLPERMRGNKRTPVDDSRLRMLHYTINPRAYFSEPKYYASSSGAVPRELRKVTQPSSAIAAMRL